MYGSVEMFSVATKAVGRKLDLISSDELIPGLQVWRFKDTTGKEAVQLIVDPCGEITVVEYPGTDKEVTSELGLMDLVTLH